jgi:hypothetical protein
VILEVASLAGADGSSPRGPWLRGLWFAVIATTVAGWVGLFAFVREARHVYLGAWLGYLGLLALGGPVVSSAGGYALQMLTALVGGAVVALAYLSDLRSRFRPVLPGWPRPATTGG